MDAGLKEVWLWALGCHMMLLLLFNVYRLLRSYLVL
jgi:hypothetical protein